MKRLLFPFLILILLVTNAFTVIAIDISNLKENYDDIKTKFLSQYKDVGENDWYTRNVVLLSGLDIIKGYGDGTFKPNDTLTRGQFIKMVVTALGYTNIQNGKDYWATPYIGKATQLGLIEEQFFIRKEDFDIEITREEMADIISRALDEGSHENLYHFSDEIKDFVKISAKASVGVLEVYSKGIITGYPDGEFKPEKGATRAEGATIIIRFLDSTERKIMK